MEFSTGQPLAEYNRIYKETDLLYHNLALRMGLADSELVILYTLALSGDGCLQRDIVGNACLSKQTVNSALRRMEGDGLIYLESAGRGKDVCLTPEGEALVQRTAWRVIQAENQVFAAWPQADVEQYLALTRRFQEALAQKAREIKEES